MELQLLHLTGMPTMRRASPPPLACSSCGAATPKERTIIALDDFAGPDKRRIVVWSTVCPTCVRRVLNKLRPLDNPVQRDRFCNICHKGTGTRNTTSYVLFVGHFSYALPICINCPMVLFSELGLGDQDDVDEYKLRPAPQAMTSERAQRS